MHAARGVDRATALAFATRVTQLVAAPVTLVLIARGFSPDVQGYYYTFASLLGLQSFVELGFSIVVTNVASHEWARLALEGGRVVGDTGARRRLRSLVALVARWYAGAALVFLLAAGAGGAWFLGHAPAHGAVEWVGPWMAVVALTAAMLWLSAFVAVLDGCNQYAVTNQFRLAQSLLTPAAVWMAIVQGALLWTVVVAAAVNVAVTLALLAWRYRPFFVSLAEAGSGAGLVWRTDIWPMQWRLAVAGAVNYLAFSLFNPVMFAYRGPAVAGQMGMTLAAIRGLQMVGQAWIDTQVARFGALVARREFRELDRLFARRTATSVAVVAAGGAAFWVLVFGLHAIGHPLAARLLEPLPTALFLVAAVFTQVSIALSAYLRAHKREPLMALNVATSVGVAAAVLLLGSRFGPLGAAAGNAGAWALSLAWEWRIWRRCRREWHAPDGQPSPSPASVS